MMKVQQAHSSNPRKEETADAPPSVFNQIVCQVAQGSDQQILAQAQSMKK